MLIYLICARHHSYSALVPSLGLHSTVEQQRRKAVLLARATCIPTSSSGQTQLTSCEAALAKQAKLNNKVLRKTVF